MTAKEWIEFAKVLVPFGIAALGIAATAWVSIIQNRKAARLEDLRWGRDQGRWEEERRDAVAARPFNAIYQDIGMIGELATRFGDNPDAGARAVMVAEFKRLGGRVIAGLVEIGHEGVPGDALNRFPGEVNVLFASPLSGATESTVQDMAIQIQDVVGSARSELTAYQETLRQTRQAQNAPAP